MKILVIGGSYFLGPLFIEKAIRNGCSLTVFNRGTRPLNAAGVEEIRGDRTSVEDLKRITGDYDAVVDFCAYEKGDIDRVREALDGRLGRYVFISTVDVYERGTGRALDESGSFETRDFGGEAGAYILGKVNLEKEIKSCEDHTVLRPSLIYGPGNYAPRENIYFKWISAAGQILEPSPSDGTFQPVYAGDVAEAALRACSEPGWSGKAFNVSPGPAITYKEYTRILRKATGTDFEVIEVTPEEAFMQQVPFPFPIVKAESEYYDGSALEKEGFRYTDIIEGMTLTWREYVHSR